MPAGETVMPIGEDEGRRVQAVPGLVLPDTRYLVAKGCLVNLRSFAYILRAKDAPHVLLPMLFPCVCQDGRKGTDGRADGRDVSLSLKGAGICLS